MDAPGAEDATLTSASPGLRALAERFERRYGLRADAAALGRLQSVVAERVRRLKLARVADYLALAEREPDEAERALELLVVGETSFFRTSAHFEALRRHVLPELQAALPPGAPLRLWSAGCATGEEAYSLAMVCAAQSRGDRTWEVLGTDLSAPSLARARRACYGQRAVARVPRELAAAYLEPCEAGQRVAATLAQHVRFEQMNLLDPLPRAALLAERHVILCENVLIYFSPDALERALANLAAALVPGGYLFLGYSERLPDSLAGFEPAWLHGTLAWRKGPARAAPLALPDAPPAPSARKGAVFGRGDAGTRRRGEGGAGDSPRVPVSSRPSSPRVSASPRPPVQRAGEPAPPHLSGTPAPTPIHSGLSTQDSALPSARELLEQGRAAQALEALRDALALEKSEIQLLAARAHADLGHDEAALEHARKAAALAPLTAAAHALLGTLLAGRGEYREAAEAFERALYLAPEEAPLVRFQFASVLRALGRAARARREFASLAGWLAQLPADHPIGEFSAGLLLQACRAQAAKLAGRG
ncbi:MAG: hypothetical protein HY690_10050 [Chloroflexi bacterium]|nr:hypothetical protein [Chloroflexota bacterium]